MNLLRKIFCCPRGSHRPNTHMDIELEHPGGQRVRYSKCLDCGHVIACVPPYGSEPWAAITRILSILPLDHYEAMRKLGIVGLQPPEPWPTSPRGGYHGGPLPPLGANPDLSDPKTLEVLQELLPKGAEPPLSGVQVEVNKDEEPSTFSQFMGQLDAVFAEIRNKQKEHKVRGRFKDHVYGAIAKTIAMLGTCCRLKVGCVLLTKEGRVAGLGYNGAGPGMDHCHEGHCNETCRCLRTLHAEQNALYSRNGDPYVAYVTAEPCLNCTKELALAGVRRVVYLKPYTSIAADERTARQEWIDHYNISWEALNDPSSPA